MKKILILASVVLLSACGVAVNYDYDKATDFSKYKSYAINSDGETGLSDLDNKRLFQILEETLPTKGLQYSSTPDFYIQIGSAEYQDQQRNTVGVGVGGSGRNVGGGISIGIPVGKSTVNRQIVFEFIDAQSNVLFWEAVSESKYNPNTSPEKREAILKTIVDKVLEKYPPKK